MKFLIIGDVVGSSGMTAVKENVLVINVDLSAGNPVNIAPNLLIGAIEKQSEILPVYKKFEKKCLLTENFEIFR